MKRKKKSNEIRKCLMKLKEWEREKNEYLFVQKSKEKKK